MYFVAFGTSQLENVGVLLVWHNARTGRELIGQLDEAEVLTVEHAGVKSQLRECGGDASHGEGNGAFHLASAHLGVDHIIV